MKKPIRKKKRLDIAELAKGIVDAATNNEVPAEPIPEDSSKNPHAVALSKLGAKKGGKARWRGTTKAQRSEAARKAALTRWRNRWSKNSRSRISDQTSSASCVTISPRKDGFYVQGNVHTDKRSVKPNHHELVFTA